MGGAVVAPSVEHRLGERFVAVRARTTRLASSLSSEDQQIQAFPEASPTKWHLAHTTWFFETFVLRAIHSGWRDVDPAYAMLFNSYYESVGERHPRPDRGLLSRPGLPEVMAYRATIDEAMGTLLRSPLDDSIAAVIELGLHHEEQHQELLLTDILANFSVNPLKPAWREAASEPGRATREGSWVTVPGGLVEIGFGGRGFHFDNEAPRHRVYLRDFELRTTTVSNAEVIAFIEDGGYRSSALWLSDGIAWVREHGVEAPRYWRRDGDGRFWHHTLYGERPVDPHAPVTHISGYEADAIATWLGARLPTEQEWETAAVALGGAIESGRWLEDGLVLPRYPGAHADAASGSTESPFLGLWGECWEWTRSAYAPYPGYRAAEGALGEYNGKFMANQWVLRGGSCATPEGHVRSSYRNFFYPHERWQFTGVRLARDLP